MGELSLNLDGRPADLASGPVLRDDHVLVPAHAFCELIDTEVDLRGGLLVACRGDLCVPLLETHDDGDIVYVDIENLAAPLGLRWSVEENTLKVRQPMEALATGLGIGQQPPAFELPDLVTGEPVTMHDFAGKKAVFYMWASW